MTTVSIIKIVKIITVLLLFSIIIPSSSYNNNVVTATTTTSTSTLPQSVQEDVLPLSDQSFSSNNSTVNTLSNENSYDQQIAAVGNKSYVVWADFITGSGDIYFKRSIDGGASFSNTTINLSNTPGRSDSPQITASGSNVYVVWSDQTTTTGNADIFFARSTDGGATFNSVPINLSNNTGRSAEPQIAVSGNNVYVIWFDRTTGNGDIYFRISTDSGATFSAAPINLSNNTGRSAEPQIAVTISGNNSNNNNNSDNNNIYVVWRDTTVNGIEDVFFKRSTDSGATFSNTINLSMNAGDSDSPQIAVSGNNVYVVWSDETTTTGNGDIFFARSTDGGATFDDTPKNLSDNNEESSEPKIAATVSGSSSNVYIVWTDKTTTTGNADIFFARSYRWWSYF